MKSASTFIAGVLGVVVGAAFVAGVVWATDDGDNSSNSSNQPTSSSQTTSTDNDAGSNTDTDTSADNTAADTDFTKLYVDVRPSIVRITTGTDASDPFDRQQQGLGSGVVLDEEGHILTNYHVVRGFGDVSVTFSDGTVAQADVVGTDPGNDIAMIQVDASESDLQPATLGDSSAVVVGEVVAAVGNPFGLDGTFTTGVISGLNRILPSSADGRPIRGLLQTDTAVNPGNSGGALFNLDGEVIGINTAIENPNGGSFAGVAYAVPINTPKRFLTQLVDGETVEHARLGISGGTISAQQAQELGIDGGVAILSVDRGSAADDAGLEPSSSGNADVIIKIDGQDVRKFEDVGDLIDSKNVGDEITLTIIRDGEEREVTATLKSWDSSA